MAAPIVPDSTSHWGYRRDPDLQRRFDVAAARLRQQDQPFDAPPGLEGQLIADLALEGGGVKGIGLVGAVIVLEEAGYIFRAVAGTSAGAIAGSLIAGLTAKGRSMTELIDMMGDLKFSKFMPKGWIHKFLDLFGRAGEIVADAGILSHRTGLYPGTYLVTWLTEKLHDTLHITSFADLELSQDDDPAQRLPADRRYRLVVHTSDITRRQLVRLPWDYNFYGHTAANEDPVHAVRASMSIPFFFVPVTFLAELAHVPVPTPDGKPTTVTYEAGSVTFVDGGMLDNFPINAFDRSDGSAPRWPTIGIKLSSLATDITPTKASRTSWNVAWDCVQTMMNEWDSYAVDEATAARTIFVDNDGIGATDFNLTPDDQEKLFVNGVTAATDFIIEMGEVGHVPRTAAEALQHLSATGKAPPKPARSLATTLTEQPFRRKQNR